ncbi:MAG TPA: xanthine dehydrogenase family protein molybdopterin-binding subunit, partial [Ottowia sp.]|nr:xanthine dehydrogenase family protein molybdopterin-binding subunit [Ottowia sp.]
MTPGDTATRFGSGQAVRRLEDEALLKGQGRYTDDLRQPGDGCLVFVRSPYAHAAIRSVNTADAEAMPGVRAILTGAQLVAQGVPPMPTGAAFKRADGSDCATPARRPLAHEVVRFVGEAVAAVVADTLQQARDAAEAVWVDYDELPAVPTLAAALTEGGASVLPAAPDNIACEAR